MPHLSHATIAPQQTTGSMSNRPFLLAMADCLTSYSHEIWKMGFEKNKKAKIITTQMDE
jgi:hypothetical protein